GWRRVRMGRGRLASPVKVSGQPDEARVLVTGSGACKRTGGTRMTDYTAHVQVPDAAIGAVLHDLVLGEGVSCATLRSGQGTWLSFGLNADGDDAVTMEVGRIRHVVSVYDTPLPEGYESLISFESAPLIITHGRTVIYSEGV